MRILSIDWDYFQVVGSDLIRLYPDGIDKPPEESLCEWRKIYKEHPGLYRVDVNRREYNLLIDLLERQDKSIPVLIRQSHIHVYDYIHSIAGDNEPISLTNIDMHHDLINDNPDLDCGNWIMHLIRESRIDKQALKWVSNPISLFMYGLNHLSEKDADLKKVLNQWHICGGLEYLTDRDFDAVYIARSDPWSPPHLDCYFEQLTKTISDLFTDARIMDDVNTARII